MNGRIYDPVLGRFLSTDEGVQFPSDLHSYNRYSYVRNNPLTSSDPTGWYEEGGHLYATYLIALAAGLSSDRAAHIAHYANYPDEHRETTAFQNVFVTAYDSIFHHSRLDLAQRTLHMLNGAEGSRIIGIRNSLNAEIANSQISDSKRGLLIHAFGDSYAHSDEGLPGTRSSDVVKLFSAPFGHLFSGHIPDIIGYNTNRKDLFIKYANSLYGDLKQMAGGSGNPKLMDDLISTINNLKTENLDARSENKVLKKMAESNGYQAQNATGDVSADEIRSTEDDISDDIIESSLKGSSYWREADLGAVFVTGVERDKLEEEERNSRNHQ